MRQTTLFDEEGKATGVRAESLLLYALGEFQERGKLLAGRDLPFDRLRGAFRRAADSFGVEELGDEEVAASLAALGARVRRVPTFFAKHPFRVVVPAQLAERARAFFIETKKTD
ncbi:MAG TPA: hypothetical protein VF611_11905 [Pyrinomonadaceae bacterium]|jgi:hypothetical protein